MKRLMVDGGLLGVDDAAGFLGLAPRSVHRLIQRGALTPVRLPGFRRTLLDRRDVEALVESARRTDERH